MDQNIPSPCVSICRLDASGELCIGCLRTLDEIRLWSTGSDAWKKLVWARIEHRLSVTEK